MLTGLPPPSKNSALACSATAVVVFRCAFDASDAALGPEGAESRRTSCEFDAAIERSMAHD